jgi:hypothetical protein
MDIYGKIAQKIQEIAGTGKLQQAILFTAETVSIQGTTCTVKLDELFITGVRLRSVINENKEQLLLEPKVGSYVLVADLSGGNYRSLAVIGYSEVTAIHIKIGNTTIDIDQGGIVFNGGKLKGLVKIEAMIDWMSKLYNDLQTLKNQLQAQPVVGQGAPLNLIFNPTVPQPQVTDFENEKVKQ